VFFAAVADAREQVDGGWKSLAKLHVAQVALQVLQASVERGVPLLLGGVRQGVSAEVDAGDVQAESGQRQRDATGAAGSIEKPVAATQPKERDDVVGFGLADLWWMEVRPELAVGAIDDALPPGRGLAARTTRQTQLALNAA